MVKYLILLAICLPLGWATYQEGQRLYDLVAHPPSPDDVPALNEGGPAPGLEAAKANAEAVVNLPEAVTAAAVRSADDAPDPATAPEPRALSEPILTHARALAEARRKIEAVRLQAAALERQIEDLRATLAGDGAAPSDGPDPLARLEDRVKVYRDLEINNPSLIQVVTAEIAWIRLQREHPPSALDRLYARLDRWSPGLEQDDLGSADEIGAHVEALRAYLDEFEGIEAPQVARAREQLALWVQGERLLAIVRPEGTADRLGQLTALAALAQEGPGPAQFARAVRELTRALCADYLKREGLDPIVLVQGDQGEAEPVPRRDVRVRWKSGTIQELVDSGYDEYTLPRDRVEHLFVGATGTRELPRDPKVSPLKGTPYSDAVHAFNAERDKIERWSEEELSRLRFVCTPYQEALARGGPDPGGPRLLERIDALLALARRHPRLFLTASP